MFASRLDLEGNMVRIEERYDAVLKWIKLSLKKTRYKNMKITGEL
jgi:hypothetical protein